MTFGDSIVNYIYKDMCVIVHKPKGVKISEDLMSELWNRNPDGAGYVVNVKNQWKRKKGIMLKVDFLNAIKSYLGEDTEFVAHLRIKTKGSICSEHTHPFDWSDNDSSRLMFHNGTIRFLDHKIDSDSLYLSKVLKNTTTDEGHDLLKFYTTQGFGRFVTLVDGKVNIFPDEESVTHEGVWFSNKRHIVETNTKPNSRHVYDAEDLEGFGYVCDWEPVKKPVAPSKSPVQTAKMREYLKEIGKFYAIKSKKMWDEGFQNEFEMSNGLSSFSEELLEKVLILAKKDPEAKSDPLFEFYLAFE